MSMCRTQDILSSGVVIPTPDDSPLSSPRRSTTPVAVDAGGLAEAESAVLRVLADKTGYDGSMIEMDMDLESELGVDSIKRVEIMSKVQAMLNVEVKDVDALSRTKTVGNVIQAMKAELGGSAASPAVVAVHVAAAPVHIPAAAAPSAGRLAEAESAVLRVLADKTGYNGSMIEMDMDLESELGVDSIKRVEIMSEVQAMLNVEVKDVDALSRTKTVGDVIQAMKAELGGASAPTAVAVVAAAPIVAGSVVQGEVRTSRAGAGQGKESAKQSDSPIGPRRRVQRKRFGR